MTEVDAIIKIVTELKSIHIMLMFINTALWLILFCKRTYSRTDEIKEAIKELTDIIRSRR